MAIFRGKWTDAKRDKAKEMMLAAEPDVVIARAIGMSIFTVQQFLRAYRPPVRRRRGRKPNNKELGGNGPSFTQVDIRIRGEHPLVSDREARYAALAFRDDELRAGSITASFFGDPPRGYSALDGKTGMT